MNFLSPVWMEMVADLFNFDILARVWRTWTGTDDDQLVSCSDSEIKMHEIIRTAPAATSHKQYQLVVFSPSRPTRPASHSIRWPQIVKFSSSDEFNGERISEGATPELFKRQVLPNVSR